MKRKGIADRVMDSSIGVAIAITAIINFLIEPMHLGLWIIVFIFIAIHGIISALVGIAAEKRGRGYWGWWIFSFIFSPLIGIIVVLILGETDERRLEKIREEEEIRSQFRQ